MEKGRTTGEKEDWSLFSCVHSRCSMSGLEEVKEAVMENTRRGHELFNPLQRVSPAFFIHYCIHNASYIVGAQ